MELVCSFPAWLRRKQIKETEVAVCIEVCCNQLVLALVECLITVEGSFFCRKGDICQQISQW